MDDLISRQAALDALIALTVYSNKRDLVKEADNHPNTWIEGVAECIDEIEDLPSAQPKPCDDAVSRKAAIDAALSAFSRGLLASPDIRKLPSVQPEPHWIPVSERLPESKPEDLEYPTVIVCCGDGAVTLACYYESTKEWGTGEYYDRIINPVAWMPLPEPYRAERRTE